MSICRTTLLITCCIIALFIPSIAQNQDSLAIKKYYEANAILYLGSTKYFKGNQSFPLKNLDKEIIFSRDAIYELTQYKRDRTYLELCTFASIGLLFSAIMVKEQDLKLGLLAGSLITSSISIPLSFSTRAHLGRAIWLHNRDILLR